MGWNLEYPSPQRLREDRRFLVSNHFLARFVPRRLFDLFAVERPPAHLNQSFDVVHVSFRASRASRSRLSLSARWRLIPELPLPLPLPSPSSSP